MAENLPARPSRFQREGLIFVLLSILVISGCFCQYDPFAHFFTTRKPVIADIVGTYALTRQTLTSEGLDFMGDGQAIIVIDSDNGGSFTLTNFPIWQETETGEYYLDSLLSTTGNWYLDTSGGVSNGIDDTKPVWAIFFSGIINSANLTGNAPPYGLIFTYGDPDRGKVMIFEIQQ